MEGRQIGEDQGNQQTQDRDTGKIGTQCGSEPRERKVQNVDIKG